MCGRRYQRHSFTCLLILSFPFLAATYLIGAAAAAQLAHYCQKDISDFDDKIAAGEFQDIKAWMTDKVHQHGSRYQSLDEHLEAQLGEPLNPKYFIDYLTKKYTDLYKC
jgi:carboxypeptidase Taq